MKQAATAKIVNDNSKTVDTDSAVKMLEERNKWSFEYLQHLTAGPCTARLWDHFRQWSLSQIPENQRITLSKEEIDKLGKAFINYPLRIYRITQDMGFEVKGMGDKNKRIRDACFLVGKGFSKLYGASDYQIIRKYRKAAQAWLEDSRHQAIQPSEVKKLAQKFFDTNYIETGLKIITNYDPKFLRDYVITSDVPPNRIPDYPLQFLLFALDYFLNETEYYNLHISKYKLLSGFFKEQSVALSMSDENIKDKLQQQRDDGHFGRGLQSFYKRCQEAYFLPFVECTDLEGFDGFKKTRVLVERPNSIKKELYYLYPEWEEVFKNNTKNKD